MLFKLDLITYKGIYRTIETEKLNVPTSEGRRTILSNHMPIMMPLAMGVIETSKDRVRMELKKTAVASNDTATEKQKKARAEAQAAARERAAQKKREKEEKNMR